MVDDVRSAFSLDSKSFDPHQYYAKLLANSSLKELIKTENDLHTRTSDLSIVTSLLQSFLPKADSLTARPLIEQRSNGSIPNGILSSTITIMNW
jgi:hypothetical protein